MIKDAKCTNEVSLGFLLVASCYEIDINQSVFLIVVMVPKHTIHDDLFSHLCFCDAQANIVVARDH